MEGTDTQFAYFPCAFNLKRKSEDQKLGARYDFENASTLHV